MELKLSKILTSAFENGERLEPNLRSDDVRGLTRSTTRNAGKINKMAAATMPCFSDLFND